MAAVMSRRPVRVIERNTLASRRQWFVYLTGLAEPLLYLFSIGLGVGALVGDLEFAGRTVSYEGFVAPAMMATAAMSGAILDTTYNFFVKYKYARLYEALLATPLRTIDIATGEIGWSLLRGGAYAAAFLATMAAMGLVESWWAAFAVPVSLLIGFAFAAAGLAATTYMRSWLDFDYVNLALTPMLLFSATFFPLGRYPDIVAWLVRVTPLYQGVALERSLILGDVSWALLLHVAYLAAMGWLGLRIASRRLVLLLQP